MGCKEDVFACWPIYQWIMYGNFFPFASTWTSNSMDYPKNWRGKYSVNVPVDSQSLVSVQLATEPGLECTSR